MEEVDQLRQLGDRSDLTSILNRVYMTRDEVIKKNEKRKKPGFLSWVSPDEHMI